MLDTIITHPEIVVPVAAFAVAAIAIICGAIVRIHRASVEARLKERMIDQGMSPNDIQRILADNSASKGDLHQARHAIGKPLPTK